jgi:hypothetical protein
LRAAEATPGQAPGTAAGQPHCARQGAAAYEGPQVCAQHQCLPWPNALQALGSPELELLLHTEALLLMQEEALTMELLPKEAEPLAAAEALPELLLPPPPPPPCRLPLAAAEALAPPAQLAQPAAEVEAACSRLLLAAAEALALPPPAPPAAEEALAP